ncbi:tetratricopeptide repeat protein [Nonomuraea sediminis]|uniref:tetratricopeptide repeat protein n=1 Tax=Nonomuraea sediminis TaxID=2835864 RepID=UPI001BDCD6C7|nr:tetratricopeptide repeat protein [Nonomuraea sediminis]
MHRLTQRAIRESRPPRVEDVLDLLEDYLQGIPSGPAAWEFRDEIEALVAQADAVYEVLPLTPRLYKLRESCATLLGLLHEPQRALALRLSRLADAERLFGPENDWNVNARWELARAYQAAEEYGSAVPFFERTIADLTGELGPEDPVTTAARIELAICLIGVDREQAREQATHSGSGGRRAGSRASGRRGRAGRSGAAQERGR